MSDQNGGTPIKHTGDPTQVRVTVPAGAPAVSAPQTVTPEQAAQPTAPPPPPPSHMGGAGAQTQWGAAPGAHETHSEVVMLDTLMEMAVAQQRTQRMLLALGALFLGTAIVVTLSRARAQLDLGDIES